MQKKIIALAVAGLSTAAFAQTNVTVYGVADVSAQGTNMSSHTARAFEDNATNLNNEAGKVASGGAFNMKSNSSLLGFKGTEDLGNGLKGLFQIETNVALTGQNTNQGVTTGSTGNSGIQGLRDSYVGVNSKYGTVLGGFLSTPFRSALTSFDVMPGATGDARIETFAGSVRLGNNQSALGGAQDTGYVQAASSVRATALAYALPTLYGFNGSIAYTGSNANGQNNQVAHTTGTNTQTNVTPYGALSMNLGWSGYGVDIKGAYQQAKVNATMGDKASTQARTAFSGYTSYLIGAAYTGVPGLKASVAYVRNTLGTNSGDYTGNGDQTGSQKGTNNQLYVGASYRFGNNEPRLTYQTTSNTSGLNGVGQDGATLWGANWGYYLSKRTQVYGLVSQIKNNANGVWNMASGGTSLLPTGGQTITTYGMGMRTNF